MKKSLIDYATVHIDFATAPIDFATTATDFTTAPQIGPLMRNRLPLVLPKLHRSAHWCRSAKLETALIMPQPDRSTH